MKKKSLARVAKEVLGFLDPNIREVDGIEMFAIPQDQSDVYGIAINDFVYLVDFKGLIHLELWDDEGNCIEQKQGNLTDMLEQAAHSLIQLDFRGGGLQEQIALDYYGVNPFELI